MRGATRRLRLWMLRISYFNPRSPCGERQPSRLLEYRELEFQSTLPMRGATDGFLGKGGSNKFQSTLPMRGATCPSSRSGPAGGFQSTLPMRGATMQAARSSCRRIFQSTLPMRGATLAEVQADEPHLISIHAPHAGSDEDLHDPGAVRPISIHAPHAGSDCRRTRCRRSRRNFNPRSPCGERLECHRHLPLSCEDFNPRSPCGERPVSDIDPELGIEFQSTLPMRGATLHEPHAVGAVRISIHAPHAGSDLGSLCDGYGFVISIHAPHAGSDFCSSP